MIPDFQSMMLPFLKLFEDGKILSRTETKEALKNYFKITDEEIEIKLPSGKGRKFYNRVDWARTYLKSAGLIQYPERGKYQITEEGIKILEQKPDIINIKFLKQLPTFQEWRESYEKENEEEELSDPIIINETPDEAVENILVKIKNKVGNDLLEILKGKTAAYFEYFVLQLLTKMGYGGVDQKNFEVVGKSGDNGIDGIIYQDKSGLERIYVQAKRWSETKVSSSDIRDFIGSLNLKGASKGIFITVSDFTEDAIKTAAMNPANRIILMNGKQLVQNAIEYNVGVQIKKTYEIKEVDDDFFED